MKSRPHAAADVPLPTKNILPSLPKARPALCTTPARSRRSSAACPASVHGFGAAHRRRPPSPNRIAAGPRGHAGSPAPQPPAPKAPRAPEPLTRLSAPPPGRPLEPLYTKLVGTGMPSWYPGGRLFCNRPTTARSSTQDGRGSAPRPRRRCRRTAPRRTRINVRAGPPPHGPQRVPRYNPPRRDPLLEKLPFAGHAPYVVESPPEARNRNRPRARRPSRSFSFDTVPARPEIPENARSPGDS